MQNERKNLFRSIAGCTVCGVKSARHVFLDSSKWECFLLKTFSLKTNCSPEICHMCVKLIRKYRNTPKHIRPDLSYMVKSTPQRKPVKRRRSSLVEMEIGTKEENKLALMEENDELSTESEIDDSCDGTYFDTSSSESADEKVKQKDAESQTTFLYPALTSPQANDFKLPYIDLSKWRQEEICCGVIFRGPSGEVLVDPKWLKPNCGFCNRSCMTPSPIVETSKEISIFDEKLASLIEPT